MNVLEIGKTYLFFIPPSWFIGGTVQALDAEYVVLKDATYLESVQQNTAMLSHVPRARTAEDLHAAISRSWPVPDGHTIRREALLMITPCLRDLTPLSRADDAAALKSAK